MKILLVSDLYPLGADSSIPSVLEDFALAFCDFGFKVSVLRSNFLLNTIIRGHKVFKEKIFFKNGIKIYNRNFILPFLNNKIDFLDEKFDLIISHMPAGNIYASLINKRLKLPHIAIVHNSDFVVLNSPLYKFYFRKKLKDALIGANLVGARNKTLFEKMKADFILPSFIDTNDIVLKKKINDDKKLKIVTLSKLIKRKNINLVIEALSEFKGDFEYNVYGSGKEEKKLKKLIKKNNLENKIKIRPHVNHGLINKVLDENDIFILPSVNETFGLVYLEAMARGLIVAGVKNEGADGVIKDGVNGFLVEAEKEAIIKLLNKLNKIDKKEIIKNTLVNIQDYKREKIINKYVDIIKKIL